MSPLLQEREVAEKGGPSRYGLAGSPQPHRG